MTILLLAYSFGKDGRFLKKMYGGVGGKECYKDSAYERDEAFISQSLECH